MDTWWLVNQPETSVILSNPEAFEPGKPRPHCQTKFLSELHSSLYLKNAKISPSFSHSKVLFYSSQFPAGVIMKLL